MDEPLRTAPRAHPSSGGVRRLAESIGETTLGFIEDVGGMLSLAARVGISLFRSPWRVRLILGQMDFIGVGSTFLVALTGLFTGMVFATQSISAFAMFRAESLVGPVVTLSVTRELAPVLTALMMTMRAGSAMCTELGTMRVTEQIDALVTLAVDPVKYLVFPRVLAGVLMAPVLCTAFDAAGLFGTYAVAIWVEGLSSGPFLAKIQYLINPSDITHGLIKSAVFGLIIAVIACYKGINARGGAKGVGLATTAAMVQAAVAIFMFDYLLDVVLVPAAIRLG
jgi:phospholipid/cholesterol/gamma-HCH transport system permease protein